MTRAERFQIKWFAGSKTTRILKGETMSKKQGKVDLNLAELLPVMNY
jgi:hypothetical protein